MQNIKYLRKVSMKKCVVWDLIPKPWLWTWVWFLNHTQLEFYKQINLTQPTRI